MSKYRYIYCNYRIAESIDFPGIREAVRDIDFAV